MIISPRPNHTCSPKLSQRCFICTELLPTPYFCSSCGMDISEPHICPPKPVKHNCRPVFSQKKCNFCGMFLPKPYYCSSCGMDISDPHNCDSEENFIKSMPLFRNSHTCRPYVYSLNCSFCGLPLPTPYFCSSCGVDISEPHICPPKPSKHICQPTFLQQQCYNCGMFLLAHYYCSSCGMDISEPHECHKMF
jgi:hypothetical protein